MYPDIESILREFSDYLSSALTELEIAKTFLPIERTKHDEKPGVYLIFSEDKSLAYVGMSKSQMGREIWTYALNAYKPNQKVTWRKDPLRKPFPKIVYTIALPEASKYIAPALESFFIDRLGSGGTKLLNVRP